MIDHSEVTQLGTAAAELLEDARGHESRRAARTVVTGSVQRATLIALLEGAEMAEHSAPPAATIHVITGQVRLHTRGREWILDGGQLAAIPSQRHGLTAQADSVVLLTVALR